MKDFIKPVLGFIGMLAFLTHLIHDDEFIYKT